MRQDLRKAASMATAMLAVATAFMAGCGGETESEPLSAVDFSHATLANCLKVAGVDFARSVDDLDFLAEAEAEETASLFASTYDRSAELFVDLWEDGDDSREWLMWAAQPFDQDMSPLEIVGSAPSEAYVAYMQEPTSQQERAVDACTNS